MNQAALVGALTVPILVVLLLLLSWHCCCRRPKSDRRKGARIGSDVSRPSYASNLTYHSYDRPNVPVPAYFAQGAAVPPAAGLYGHQPQGSAFNNTQQRAQPYGLPYRIPRRTGQENILPAPQPTYNPILHPQPLGYGYPAPLTTPTPSRRHSRRPRERGRTASKRRNVTTASSSSTWSRPPFPFPPYATVEDEVEWTSAKSAA